MARLPICALLALSLAACGGSIGDSSENGADGGGGGGDGEGDANTCARVQVDLAEQVPTVMLLIDRSGSMTAGFGGTDRWNATYGTLMNASTGVVKSLEDRVRFGVALYTSKNGFAGTEELEGQPAGTCPMLAEVVPALGNYSAIDAMYAPKGPITDTPTGASLVAVTATLAAVTEPGPKIIVVATDGEPDSCTIPNPANEAERVETRGEAIAAAQDAFTAGIETYVISVGDDVGAAHLQDMANAGTGLPVGGASNATFYTALNPDQLITAFDDIIAGVRTCVFTLDGQVSDVENSGGTVSFDSLPLEEGTDWRLNDASTLEILGSKCEELLAGGQHTIEASFECGAIVE